jgi:tetratricopeptide (TPR) repeat protein
MYSCPCCGAESAADRSKCPCGADLSLLARLDGVADAWFNEGLQALERGARGRALEWVSACCAARPTDAAARLVQARLWGQLGLWAEASDALERAAAIDPTLPELTAVREALAALHETR